MASGATTIGVTILVASLELLASAGLLGRVPLPLWLWSHRWLVVACTAVLVACYCGLAVLGAALWARPRVEIGPDGFVDYGVVGRRARCWGDIQGEFTVIRVGWPVGLRPRPVVAYRLTDAFKQSARVRPLNSLAGNDEAILICGELVIEAGELADVLNRWKQREANATTPK
jgi:hypothetical protein